MKPNSSMLDLSSTLDTQTSHSQSVIHRSLSVGLSDQTYFHNTTKFCLPLHRVDIYIYVAKAMMGQNC